MRTGGGVRAAVGRGRSIGAWCLVIGVTTVFGVLVGGVPGFGAGTVPAHTHLRPEAVTTVPAPTTTTTPPPAPTTTTTTPRAPAPAPAKRGILPPDDPPANITPSPNFLSDCQGSQYDDSTGCVNATLSAIDNARAQEGVPAMQLPSNWYGLSPAEQIFVVTNLERVDRGLPPLQAMASALDQSAQQGAAADTDPSPPSGFPWTQWGANWAGAVGNPLEADYYWMYDDGPGSSNVDCTAGDSSGCWGHRNNVLMDLSCQMCVMGTAFAPTAYNSDPSLAEILVDSSGQPAVDFTWQQEQAYF